MTLLSQLLPIVVPIFACVGLGMLWARLRAPFDSGLITSLVYNVGAPCLILATFDKVTLPLDVLGSMLGAALACFACFGAIAWVVLKLTRLEPASYLPSLVFPLTGSMGLPVCYFALDDEGLALAIVYFTVGAVGTFTVGLTIAQGSRSLRRLAGVPVIYAVILAIILQVADIRLPAWIFNTTDLIGGIVIPTQLVALGVSLLEMKASAFARSVWLGLLRLAMGFAVGVLIAAVFGLDGAARSVVILQSAMPVAISTYLFAQRFDRKPEEVAGMVIVSTVISFVTLPLLMWFVLPS